MTTGAFLSFTRRNEETKFLFFSDASALTLRPLREALWFLGNVTPHGMRGLVEEESKTPCQARGCEGDRLSGASHSEIMSGFSVSELSQSAAHYHAASVGPIFFSALFFFFNGL